jgi:GrpB-like predicted nucleotidyltransferase (UPF0157 family)
MSDEIEIIPYQPEWPALFATERQTLLGCLPSDMVLDIAHFGSTAIPGMAAKPIIDILIAVRSVTHAKDALPSILAQCDYDFWADNPKQDRAPNLPIVACPQNRRAFAERRRMTMPTRSQRRPAAAMTAKPNPSAKQSGE